MIHNQHRVVASSAAITANGNSNTANGAAFHNNVARGLHLIVDITAVSGTSPTLTVTIEGFDSLSGQYYTLLASTALNATGTTVLKVYPGLTASANVAANDVLPKFWRVKWVIGGTATPTVTASIAASLIV